MGSSAAILGGVAEGLMRGLETGQNLAMQRRRMSLEESAAKRDADYRQQMLSLQQASAGREARQFEQQQQLGGLQIEQAQRANEQARKIDEAVKAAQAAKLPELATILAQNSPTKEFDPDSQKFNASKAATLDQLNRIAASLNIRVLDIKQAGLNGYEVTTLSVPAGTQEMDSPARPETQTFSDLDVAVYMGLGKNIPPAATAERFLAAKEKREAAKAAGEERLSLKALDVYGKMGAATSKAAAAQKAAAAKAAAAKPAIAEKASRQNMEVLRDEYAKLSTELANDRVTEDSAPAEIVAHNDGVRRLARLAEQINEAWQTVNPAATEPLKAPRPAVGRLQAPADIGAEEFMRQTFRGTKGQAPSK